MFLLLKRKEDVPMSRCNLTLNQYVRDCDKTNDSIKQMEMRSFVCSFDFFFLIDHGLSVLVRHNNITK